MEKNRQQLLETMPDGIFVVDERGRIEFASRLALKMSGYSRSELIGRSIDILVPSRQRAGHRANRARYLTKPEARSMGTDLNIRLRRKDGTDFPADIALSPMTTPEGLKVIAAVRDVSERTVAKERLAVMEDRERIARELHDGAIQSLFAVGMGLQGLAARVTDDELQDRLETSVVQIDGVIRDLRNYIFGLRPDILADTQLQQALTRVAQDFQKRTGVITVVDVDHDVATRLNSQAGELIQLTTEALSNVARHAQATTCRVSLTGERSGDVLEIDDDGKGFEKARLKGTGQGMRNLRERASKLGGRLAITSNPGRGTSVRVTIRI